MVMKVMKVLLKLVPACLATLVLLSPPLVVWKIWQCHIEFSNTQQIVLSDPRLPDRATASLANEADFLPTEFIQLPFQTIPLAIAIPALLGFVVSVPLGFYSGKLLNDRQQSRRSTTLRQQIATLERIWQQSLY